jgi:hypothetical protein
MIGSHCARRRRDGADRSDMADERVVDHDGKIAAHLQLVAAADNDALNTRDRRLADLRSRSCMS